MEITDGRIGSIMPIRRASTFNDGGLAAASADQAAAFSRTLYFGLFRHFQCVIDLDPQVSTLCFPICYGLTAAAPRVDELSRSRTIADPARERLIETRKSLVSTWMKAAAVLDAQGEIILAGDVRYFASHLQPVLTDRQRLATQLIGFIKKKRGTQGKEFERNPKDYDLAR